MSEFTYRVKTFQTPKKGVRTQPTSNVVTRSEFRRLNRKVVTIESEDAKPQSYLPFSHRRKKEVESPPFEEAPVHKKQKKNDNNNIAAPPLISLNNLQKLWKVKLDDQMKRATLRYQGTQNTFLIDSLQQICERFIQQIGKILSEDSSEPPTVPPSASKKSKAKTKEPKIFIVPNPKNIELEKKEKILKQIIERLNEEKNQWEEVKTEYSGQPPKRKLSVLTEKIPPETIINPNKSLETLILQVDELKPILKEMKQFNTVAEKFCGDVSSTINTIGSFGKGDPKELVRSLAFADE